MDYDLQQEFKFPQDHPPADVIAFDFVDLGELGITIQSRPFPHLMIHAVFTYSNWEYIHRCHTESFEALCRGLQDALHVAGGVPLRVRSDSMTAAVNSLQLLVTPRSHHSAVNSHPWGCPVPAISGNALAGLALEAYSRRV